MNNKQKKPEKQWYSVRVEGMAPVTVEYRVYAENEDDAFNIFQTSPQYVQLQDRPRIDHRKIIKKRVVIKNLLTGMINWIRQF